MKKIVFLVLLSFVLISNLRAQKAMIKGYVIQLNGDTTKGFIAYKNWNKNPASIYFYKEITGTKQRYDTLNIKGFGVNEGKYQDDYVLQTIDLENSEQDLDRLNTDINPVFAKKTIFLQKIVTGLVSLFKYTDSTNREHYIIMKNNVYEDLRYKRYYFTEEHAQIAYNEEYKEQLSRLMDNCNTLTAGEIERTTFRENELIKIIQHYNTCISPSTSSVIRETEKLTVKFGALAGASFTSLKMEYLDHFTDLDFKSSTDLTAGVSMLVTIPRTSEKIGLYVDLTYRRFNFSGDHQKTTSSDQYTIDHFRFNGDYLKINTLFRYTFANSKIKPYINAGMSNALALAQIEKTTTESVFYSTSNTRENSLFGGARKHEQGIVLGFGASHKNIGFELRGEISNGFSSINTAKTKLTTGYFLLHYQF